MARIVAEPADAAGYRNPCYTPSCTLGILMLDALLARHAKPWRQYWQRQ